MCVTLIRAPFENDNCEQYHLLSQPRCAFFQNILIILYYHADLAYRKNKFAFQSKIFCLM